ncbi:MAG: DUF1049 domain-containing protein [Leptolyngbyaceae cyanobacterium SM1_1_3]|nr:DUF1049 domain-containing protein [Leptolyngbyaceae cyanobacterium SM1_1_3]NJM84805.1 DUF1049 domain-containing protein [Leptolyngbyaceae cyanobacterium RM2_2_21]NJN02841.1 DUF1049 domain-containing protein [Leptolyngbyaceae cyanobacterium RM1_1_2]NJO09086.1 DUF1049 domain-containing protein [Leptolyngbyaceae cyanobacterium SL_1_1]
MIRLSAAVILAIWISAVAVIAAQNGAPISLRFLTFRSVELPLGIALAFCVAGGLIVTALLLSLFESSAR